jgi:hypothetical protein
MFLRLLKAYVWVLLAVYHWLEVNFRLRLMGLGKAQKVEKLSDAEAIELGSDMLGELVIFSLAALTLYAEYYRSSVKDALKEEQLAQEKLDLKNKLQVKMKLS